MRHSPPCLNAGEPYTPIGDIEHYDADVAFHRAVAHAARNDLLTLLLDAIAPLLRELRTAAWAGWTQSGGGFEEIVEAHAAVLERLSAHDGDGAALAMQRHLHQARFGLETTPHPEVKRRPILVSPKPLPEALQPSQFKC